jgi:hypothetical protein
MDNLEQLVKWIVGELRRGLVLLKCNDAFANETIIHEAKTNGWLVGGRLEGTWYLVLTDDGEKMIAEKYKFKFVR